MIRLTHRRCRAETEALAATAHRQTQRADELADDLRAAEHAMDEVRAACQDLEYATTEAAIPAVLRDRLVDHQIIQTEQAEAVEQVDRLTTERDRLLQQRVRVLQDAHDQGRLLQVLALMPTEGPLPHTIQDALDQLSTLTWRDAPWWCPAECGTDTRTLAWHELVPDRAHLACECGRVWPAPAGAVARVRQELTTRELVGGVSSRMVRWADRPRHELQAIDRALPTPDQLRDREVVPA